MRNLLDTIFGCPAVKTSTPVGDLPVAERQTLQHPLPARHQSLVKDAPASASAPDLGERLGPRTSPQAASTAHIAIDCAVTGATWIAEWRQNPHDGKFRFKGIQIPGPGVAAGSNNALTYRLDDLGGLKRVACPFCKAGIPIYCGAGNHYVCRGGISASGDFFQCCCGNADRLMSGLETVHGSKAKTQAAPFASLPRGNSAPRLSATPVKLLPRR